jgi:hypothetical protein
MANHPPPVPPAGRTDKAPADAVPDADQGGPNRAVPANVDQQDRQGNIKQNTTHQGHQQDR